MRARHRLGLALCLVGVVACDGRSKKPRTTEAPTPTSPPAESGPAEPAEPAKPLEPALPPATATATPDAANFIDELRFLYRVAACGGDRAGIEAPISSEAIDAHCRKLRVDVDKYRSRWLARARPFFAEHVPGGVPSTVVYPFAGADLLTALAVFPDFNEATTLSLEPAGDPRRVETMSAGRFRQALGGVRVQLHNLLVMNHNLTKKMITHFRGGGLPGHLIFTLKALEIHGLEPRAAYYFEVAADGSIDYLTEAEIAAFPTREGTKARNARFGSIEIHFAKPGDSRTRVYRHILANLDDEHLAAAPGVLAHLEAKGKVAMITKAASYLLWWGSFSKIRAYMLGHMAWMVSDSTGIPPSLSGDGFTHETWGRFGGAILQPSAAYVGEMKRLWRSQPRRPLRFRFGYPDANDLHHLMITKPPVKP